MVNISKILITGANGSIGQELDFGLKVSRKELDVASPDSIGRCIKRYRPEAVLNLASVNIRDSEKEPKRALEINAIGTYNLAIETEKRKIPIIIISTGSIFNGPYETYFNEESKPSPQNMYGQTKYLAELFASLNPQHLIVRTGWLFGFTKKKNFFNSIYEKLVLNQDIIATYDQRGSPTFINDFISCLKKLISTDARGIYHVSNADGASALELIDFVATKLNSKSVIDKVSIDNQATPYIKRSKSEVLSSKKITLRSWKLALEEHISNYRP
jgi:dTDP-4-dehydrorhamnose reductase